MNTRLTRTIAVSALPLIMALLGCAVSRWLRPPGPSRRPRDLWRPSVHEVAQTTTLNGGNTGPVSATCPQGEVALGGGWNVPPQQARVFAATLNGNTWSLSVLPLGHPATTTVTAYVECLRNAPGAVVTQRPTTENLNPTPTGTFNDNLGGTISLCDSGETLVGGGFDLGPATANLELEATWPRNDVLPVQMWVFSVRNYDTVAHSITHYAECLSGVTVSASYPRQDGSPVYASQTGTATVSCSAGSSLAGGGFQYRMHSPGPSRLGNLFSLNAASSGWQGQVTPSVAMASTISLHSPPPSASRFPIPLLARPSPDCALQVDNPAPLRLFTAPFVIASRILGYATLTWARFCGYARQRRVRCRQTHRSLRAQPVDRNERWNAREREGDDRG